MGVQGSMGMTGDEDRGKHGTPGYQGSGYGPNPHETPGRYWSYPFLCPLPGKERPTFLPSAAQQGQPKVKEA